MRGFFFMWHLPNNESVMNIVLFESSQRNCLLPLVYTRPVALLRTGILTIMDKWKQRINGQYSFKTEPYLADKYPQIDSDDNFLLSSHVCPTDELTRQVLDLNIEEGIKYKGIPIALRTCQVGAFSDHANCTQEIRWTDYKAPLDLIQYPWDLTEVNGRQIELDYELLTKGRQSTKISSTNNLIKEENIFVEEGAKIEFATINASKGFVYIGRDAEIMEGSLIRGPFALCHNSVVNMGSKIYGATTVGPHSKVGGEIMQSIITGFSNKGHDGFLGNSILGEWCNLGAGTNVSNLKNTYDKVKAWSYSDNKFIQTGLQFCGLIMGDHSKAGINTMFNTGTVVGVGANIFGAGFPRQFVPSFSMGGAQGYKENRLSGVISTASQVMIRRNEKFTELDQQILANIYETSTLYRKF